MNAANDKRTISNEGFMLADAVIAKAGDLPYTRGELGLDGNPRDIVMLSRTEDVLKKALPTMKGAPITIGHPPAFLGTGDARGQVVGAVATEPVLDSGGNVRASVRIFDKEAIRKIQGGLDQLSPGFNFVPANLEGDRGEIRDMNVNHVALVDRGRAGEAVRVLDHLPSEIVGIDMAIEESTMPNIEGLADAVKKAVDSALSTKAKQGMSDQDVRTAIGDSITAAIAPIVEGMKTITEKQAKDEAAAEAKQAEDAAKAEKDKIIDEVMKAERVRYQIVQDATPFIAEDKRDGLLDMSAVDILKLAVGDSVKGADEMSEDRLYGILQGKMLAADQKPTEIVDAGMVTRKPKSDMKAKDVYKERFNKARGMKEGD